MKQAVVAETVTPRPISHLKADISAVRAIAQAAVSVELFTIPLYLAAMTSIQGMHQITGKDQDFYKGRLWPGPAPTAEPQTANEEAVNIFFSVFIEEMLHLQMAANLASCIGVKPTFTSPLLQDKHYGWTCYGPDKTKIPHIIDLTDTLPWSDITVDIGAVDEKQVRLFEAIEQPEEGAKDRIKPEALPKYFPTVPFEGWKQEYTDKDLPMFGTIGHMYLCYYDYLNLSYAGNPEKKLWEYLYDRGAVQRDLFNVERSGHPKREYLGFDTTIDDLPDITRRSLRQVWDLISAITDQGEGSELPRERPRAVLDKYQASQEALAADYPSYTDDGKLTKSADAAARHDNGGMDHYERFAEVRRMVEDDQILTWPQWRAGQERPWRAEDLRTASWQGGEYKLPSPEDVAEAMNDLGGDPAMYERICQAAVGSIAGITTVLNKYWSEPNVTFPYPSMAGSGDRMAICWALFRKAPVLKGSGEERPTGKLLHACQGLDLTNTTGQSNDCAAVPVYHSCRGSNACKAEGGCGFVQNDKGGGSCGFGLVKAKIVDDTADDDAEEVRYSAPGDNRCGGFGGCAVPISASQIFPKTGTMQLYDFEGKENKPTKLDKTIPFKRGETVYEVAYRAYKEVMKHRGQAVPEEPKPNNVRLAFPPSKVSSSTNVSCTTRSEKTHSPTGFTRTRPEPRPPARPPSPCPVVPCRFHTCRPVYRGLPKIASTVRRTHRCLDRWPFRPGSLADGHGAPRSLSSRTNDATERPFARSANIQPTHGAVRGSGTNTFTRRPHPACSLFGCAPPSANMYP
ncbi:Ferritin-like protein [Actinokineospora sp. UTMC 2448]|nr:Ferritin-like protein [Actinokineospora sp. UTMC 2448]